MLLLCLPLLGHCNFRCSSSPSDRIKLPIQSDKSSEDVQKAVLAALPDIKGQIARDLQSTFQGFAMESTRGTWFSVSRSNATINGKNYNYCELIVSLKYQGQKPGAAEVSRIIKESATRKLEAMGWKVAPLNPMGMPDFE